MGLEDDNRTTAELILQLRSSFFSSEFEKVAKTLMEREEQMKEMYWKLKTKAREEKDVIFKENVKLKDELKLKEEEIEVLRKQIAEYQDKVRVCENCFDDDKCLSSEKKVKESMGSSINLTERCTPPRFAEKKDIKHKSDAKLPEIIDLDDDDDDDDNQGKQLDPEPDSDSDTENVNRSYMSSIAKVKKAKGGWKSELSTLARKLIDGDPQNELKKKASDLNRFDLGAVGIVRAECVYMACFGV
ncbi:hypothetical protein M8C21_009284 [Ambrosia artemisiifolia]|uniref:Uncharacterized protein n=1 Tax=Ambrosia artemisiifolia TaxID=4212 RepID=A0AAD5CXI5_AMBAR|nr:hypothetical protein M8C21_009284 [Ambrosia artemisiifolia]